MSSYRAGICTEGFSSGEKVVLSERHVRQSNLQTSHQFILYQKGNDEYVIKRRRSRFVSISRLVIGAAGNMD